jgi:hypothetical protein
MRSSAKRKRAGRPRAPQRRPVLAARVPEDFHARILTSAALNGRNASEELIWRAQQSFEYEARREADLKLLRDAQKMTAEGLLQQLGYTKVHTSSGPVWFPPGVNVIDWITATSSSGDRIVLQDMLDRAAFRALEKLKESQS